MHIVHCLTHSTFGGGQAVPYLLVRTLRQFHPEFHHTVILPAGGEYVRRFASLGADIIEFPFDRLDPKRFIGVRQLLGRLHPKVIHTHGRGAGLYIRSIPIGKIRAGKIHTHHGFHRPSSFGRKYSFTLLERFLDQNTDLHIAVSASEREEIAAVVGTHRSIELIPNIVDRDATLKDAQEPYAGDYHFDRFTVAMIGRNDPIKNYPLAFAIVKKVLQRSAAIRFIFIGIDPEHPDLTALRSEFPGSVICAGRVNNPLPLLRQASLLLITSAREGAPLSVLEAMALGKPVVGTNVRGINDIVNDGVTGVLRDGSAEILSQTLLDLESDRHTVERMSVNAVAYIHEHCDVRGWSGRYARLYSSMSAV